MKELAKKENRPLNFLEIGISHGGSLKMWRNYFGSEANIYALDINPHCTKMSEEGFNIIGDQEDKDFLRKTFSDIVFDIIIDDGGHTMKQQINSFEALYPQVNPNGGIYLCEDTHTSYWSGGWQGGLYKPDTFMEYSKKLIDVVNAWHVQEKIFPCEFTFVTKGIYYYDSIVVFEKKPRDISKPVDLATGDIKLF